MDDDNNNNNNNKSMNAINDRHDNGHGRSESKTKRRRTKENHHALYQEVAFAERQSTGRPGSPHRFFSKSYRVTTPNQDCNSFLSLGHDNDEQSCSRTSESGQQIVHQHANSLVIVTAGYLVRDELEKRQSQQLDKEGDVLKIERLQYLQSVGNSQSVGGKRKKPKTVNGVGVWDAPGIVRPNDKIAVVTFSDGSTLDLKCCVAGTLLEINDKLSTFQDDAKEDGDLRSLLIDDPLLDGYLAVVKPIGFPCNLI
jgi:hypothetical protein